MRGRIFWGSLCACMLAASLAQPADARNPKVKIIQGARFAAAADDETARMPGEPLPDADDQREDAEPSSLFDSRGSLTAGDTDACAPGGAGPCECGGEGCCLCCRPFGWTVGIEATYLKPDFQESNDGIDPPNNFQYEAAPRVWTEYVLQNGWGLRGAYWTYDADQSFARAAIENDTVAAINVNDDLDLYAVDLELTRRFSIDRSDFWLSLGARNGRLKRGISQQFTIFDLAGGGGDDATFIQQQFDRDFNGTGITTNIGLYRPLGTSRFGLVSNFRNSVLWGGNRVTANGRLAEVVPVAAGDLDLNDFSPLSLSGSNSQAMWIGEFQVGCDWRCPLAGTRDGGWVFARLVFEAQWWKVPGVDIAGFGPDHVNSQMYDFMGVSAAAGICR